MPIIDYAERARKDELWFYALPTISDDNKDAVRRFLKIFNVAPATKSKFLRHIRFLLERLELKTQFGDRERINDVFAEIQRDISPGYFNTIINVSKRFVTWLNDGELPKSFKDVRKLSRKKERRNLRPEDMWTWEDGKKLATSCPSVQFKAIVLTQLDGGFRPSEFIDLNYGDIIIKKDIVIIRVSNGKTGFRMVPCHRCVPHLLRWYEQHPTKRPNDPLWIMEFNDKSHRKETGKAVRGYQRYRYESILKRLESLAAKLGFTKPFDFYTFRHSSCVLDKMDNLPLDVAAARHGHSVDHFDQVYGRLDLDDVANRMRRHYGGKVEQRVMEETVICERCDAANEGTAQLCGKCGSPLSLKVALEVEKQKSDDLQSLKDQLEEMREMIAQQVVRQRRGWG